jgi:hypothetical protein
MLQDLQHQQPRELADWPGKGDERRRQSWSAIPVSRAFCLDEA